MAKAGAGKKGAAARQRAQTAAAMRRDLARLSGLSGRGVTRAKGRAASGGGSGES